MARAWEEEGARAGAGVGGGGAPLARAEEGRDGHLPKPPQLEIRGAARWPPWPRAERGRRHRGGREGDESGEDAGQGRRGKARGELGRRLVRSSPAPNPAVGARGRRVRVAAATRRGSREVSEGGEEGKGEEREKWGGSGKKLKCGSHDMVVGIERRYSECMGAEKLNIENRISMTRTEYSI